MRCERNADYFRAGVNQTVGSIECDDAAWDLIEERTVFLHLTPKLTFTAAFSTKPIEG